MAEAKKVVENPSTQVEMVDSNVTPESRSETDVSNNEKGLTGADHATEKEQPMTLRRFMPLVAMAFLWTGSQIPLYLFGSVPPYIYQDLGGADRWIWFVLGNLLALASICPFVGSLSDLFGRRYVAIGGAFLLILGMVVASTAKIMNVFIAGMAISGVGAGINELTALAVTAEIAPTRKRGLYVSLIVFTILPYCPCQLWAQLVASKAGWRYIGLWCGLWAFVGLVMTVVFYHPPPRANTVGMSRKEVLARIDYAGGILSVSGLLLFMMAVTWGGYNYPWKSTHVLVPLLLGAALLIGFFVWEAKFAKYPMFPLRLAKEKKTLALTLIITAISGANFFSVILFWPTQSYNVYGHDPIGIGIRNISLGFSILAGACIILALLTLLKGHIRLLILVSCIFMTAGGGAMAALRVDNLWLVYVVITIAGLGIGGIVVPASIITTIICPDDLIATVTALTLAIRVLGGAIGYAIYWNVFYTKFVHAATHTYLVPVTSSLLSPSGIPGSSSEVKATLKHTVEEVVELTGAGLLEGIRELPGLKGNEEAYEKIVRAGQMSYADAYRYVYLVSIAWGGLSCICAMLLPGDIGAYMDDHVAAAY